MATKCSPADYDADGKAIGIEIMGGARELIADLAVKSRSTAKP